MHSMYTCPFAIYIMHSHKSLLLADPQAFYFAA